jgi:FkbH-like protein
MNIHLSLYSNVNIDPISAYLKKVGFTDIKLTGYNQYMSGLLGQTNNNKKPNSKEVDFFHIDANEYWNIEIASLSNDDLFLIKLDQLLVNLKQYCATNLDSIVIISNFSFPPFSISTYINQSDLSSISLTEAKINVQLNNFVQTIPNLYIYDFSSEVKKIGFQNFFDSKLWYLGRIKYSGKGFSYIAETISRQVMAMFNSPKKVLVLDLDNTLWGGVLGELGPNGILLSEDGVGKIYRDFQQNIKKLKCLGVLLAICSKNNLDDVKELFEKNQMMVLNESDFICKKINWINKADNLKSIAKELNLGLDSIVFIDDNPVEQKIVSDILPEVKVPLFPKAIEELNSWFILDVIYPYFSKTLLTKEDIEKADQYVRNQQRSEVQNTLDLDGFIKSLDIRLNIFQNEDRYVSRISQLTQKTNQFTLTTKRYQENEIKKMILKGDLIYALDYSDRFGKEGIVGSAIVLLSQKTAKIDSFLMSCRIIGRNVEFNFILNIIYSLKAIGVIKVVATYLETKKNKMVSSFYDDCGFEKISETDYSQEIDILIMQLKKKLKIE